MTLERVFQLKRRLSLILALCSLSFGCDAHKPTAEGPALIQTIELDGSTYRRVASKANATSGQDLSLELFYAVEGDEAYIDMVRIDGVEYRADCTDPPDPPEPPYQEPPDVSREPPLPTTTEPRIEIDDHLRNRFSTAVVAADINLPSEVEGRSITGGYSAFSTLGKGEDDFFRFDLTERGCYNFVTSGDTDTYGEVFRDDDGDITFIIGTSDFGVYPNFGVEAVLDPGTHYLRVSGDNQEVEGRYQVFIYGWPVEFCTGYY